MGDLGTSLKHLLPMHSHFFHNMEETQRENRKRSIILINLSKISILFPSLSSSRMEIIPKPIYFFLLAGNISVSIFKNSKSFPTPFILQLPHGWKILKILLVGWEFESRGCKELKGFKLIVIYICQPQILIQKLRVIHLSK